MLTQIALTGYCIKHCENYLFFRDNSGNTTEDFEQARVYGSRLDAHQQCAAYFRGLGVINVEDLANHEWQIIRRRNVVQKAPPLDAPFALHISDPIEAVHRVYELHALYSQRVSSWLRIAGVPVDKIPRPATCKMTITAPKWAGIWSPSNSECHYPVVYAMMDPNYKETVAHEVVHSFQRAFTGCPSGHGADFLAMMMHAALEPVTTIGHTCNVPEAKRLSEVLRKWWRVQGQRGLLASLPVEVATEPLKRKGIE